MTTRCRRCAVAVVAVLGLVSGCGATTPTAAPVQPAGLGGGVAAPPVPTKKCAFVPRPDTPAPPGRNEGIPPVAEPETGTVNVVLHTTAGDIPITMRRAEAPCTVGNFVYLASKGFYTNTPCFGLATEDTVKELQCGDPTGTGGGGPGYTIPDEDPVNLAQVQSYPGVVVYPAGTVSMATQEQPNTGGSQFFLTYGDSQESPIYPVFGQMSASGVQVVSKIAAAGLVPAQGEMQIGSPKENVVIKSVGLSYGSG